MRLVLVVITRRLFLERFKLKHFDSAQCDIFNNKCSNFTQCQSEALEDIKNNKGLVF